jgi:hypothetical protein
MCLWLVNPQLNLLQLLDAGSTPAETEAAAFPSSAPATAAQQPSVADEFAELLSTWTAPAL